MREIEKGITSFAKLILILVMVSTMTLSPHMIPISYETPGVNASRRATVVAGSSNGYVYVYDEAGGLLWSYSTGADVASVAVSSDGSYIAVGSLGNKLFLFARPGKLLWEKTVPISSGYGGGWMGEESKSVAISAHGEYVVAACTDSLYVYKKDGALRWSHTGKETCVDISTNGENIVSCNNNDGTVRFFSIQSDTPLWTKSVGAFWVATSNPGEVVASSRYEVYMFDSDGTQIWGYALTRTGFVRVDMTSDGLNVVSGNDDPSDRLGCEVCYFNHLKDGTPGWSNADGTPVWIYRSDPDSPGYDIYAVDISENGEIIAIGPHVYTGICLLSKDEAVVQHIPPQAVTPQSIDLTSDGRFGVFGDRYRKSVV